MLAIGTNTTDAHPVIGMTMRQSKEKGTKLIVANPIEIGLVRSADIWLQHNSGSDVALLMGMARVIVDEGLEDKSFIESRCENFEAFKDALQAFPLEEVSRITGVPEDKIIKACNIFYTCYDCFLR